MEVKVTITPREKEFDTLLKVFPPKPSNKFLPDWYKKQKFTTLPNTWANYEENEIGVKTTKNCPAIRDFLTKGITIPAWSDFILVKDGDNIQWNLTIQNSLSLENKPHLKVGEHSLEQTTPLELNNIANYGTLKLTSPYYFKTPPGYGLHFYDPFYNHRNNIRLLPGMVETDIWHEVNLPFEFVNDINNVDQERIYLKAGDPLFVVVPYLKETKINLDLKNYDSDFIDLHNENVVINNSISNNWHEFKKIKDEK